VDCGLILNKYRGLFYKVMRIIWFLDYFLTEKHVDSVHEPWTMTGASVHHEPPGGTD
jgi:hypothetical protein